MNDYNISATEVLFILDYLPKEIVSKIPNKFILFLKEHSIPDYNPNFDFSKGLDKLNLNDKTKSLLAMIYRNYICSKEEQIEYDKVLSQNEENYQITLREKYNTDNIFRNNQNITQTNESFELIEYKKPKWYKKIFRKILSFFS